jgi:DNA-binding response OmpR family regulator
MASKGRILIIDDDPHFLEFARIVLESRNYEVHTAENVNDGLEAMRRLKPDLLILDVMISYSLMGLNLTKKIHNDPELNDTSIIMVSAIVDNEEMTDSHEGEAYYDCFMSKPIAPDDLINNVERFLP